MQTAIERAERHGWVVFFLASTHAHLECHRGGNIYLITVDEDGTVGVYGGI